MLVVLSSAVGDVERGGVGRVGGMTSEVPMGRHALITKVRGIQTSSLMELVFISLAPSLPPSAYFHSQYTVVMKSWTRAHNLINRPDSLLLWECVKCFSTKCVYLK